MDRIVSYFLIAWLLLPPQFVFAQNGSNEYVPPSRAEFSELPDAKTAGKFVSDKMHETLSDGLNKAIKEIGEPLGRDIAPGGKISRRTIGKFDNIAIPNKLVAGDGMLSPAEGLYALMEESFFGDLNQKTWVPCNGFREIKTADYVAAAKANCPEGMVDPFNPTCECTIFSPICFPQAEAKPIEWWAPNYVATVNRDGARRENPYIMPGPNNVGLNWSSVKAQHDALQSQFIKQLQRKIPGFKGEDYQTPKVASADFEFGQETGGLDATQPGHRSVRLRRLLWEWNAGNNRSPMVQWGYKMNELMGQPPCANNLLLKPDEPYYANTSEKGLRSLISAFPDFAMLERPLLKAGDYKLVVNSNNFQDIFQAADDNSWLTRLVPSHLASRNRDDSPDVYREGLQALEVVPFSTDRMKEIILPRSGVALRADYEEYSGLPPLSQDAVLAVKAFLYDSNPGTPGTAGKRIRRFSIHQAKESTSSFHGPQQRPEKRIFTDMLQLLTFKKGEKQPSECFGAENIPGYEVLQGPEKESWSYERLLYDQDGPTALHGETAFLQRNLQREVSCEWCGRIAGCLLLHDGDVEKNSFEGVIPRSDIPEEFRIAYKYWRGEASQAPRPQQAAIVPTLNLSQSNQGKPSFVPGAPTGFSAPPSFPSGLPQLPQAPLLNCLLGKKDEGGESGGSCQGGSCTGSGGAPNCTSGTCTAGGGGGTGGGGVGGAGGAGGGFGGFGGFNAFNFGPQTCTNCQKRTWALPSGITVTGNEQLPYFRIKERISSSAGINAVVIERAEGGVGCRDWECSESLWQSKRNLAHSQWKSAPQNALCVLNQGSYHCTMLSSRWGSLQKNPLDDLVNVNPQTGNAELAPKDQLVCEPPSSDNHQSDQGQASNSAIGGSVSDGTGAAAGGGGLGGLLGGGGGGALTGILTGLLGSLLGGGGGGGNQQNPNNPTNNPNTDQYRCECINGFVRCFQGDTALPLRDPVRCEETNAANNLTNEAVDLAIDTVLGEQGRPANNNSDFRF